MFQGQFQAWAFSKGGTAAAVVCAALGVQRGCKPLLLMEETTSTQLFRPSMASWSEIQIRYVWKLPPTSEVSGQPTTQLRDTGVTWRHSATADQVWQGVIKSGTAPSARLAQA